jgi:flagellar motor switch protein FliG
VFKEAMERITEGSLQIGGEEYVKKMLTMGLGGEDANKILEMVAKDDPLESLKDIDPQTLSNFLVSEHPQTIAVIMCLLEPDHAAQVMELLPEELRSEVAMRIARTGKIPEGALEEIQEVLKVEFDTKKGKEGRVFDGTKTIAEILNQCDRSIEQSILQNIEKTDEELADSIRNLMLVFDDLVKIDDRGFQLILKEVSTEDLALALKTAPEELKQKVFKNMSQRAVEILKDDMETMGPVRVSDVENAQQKIVRIARKLDEEGKIIIAGRGKEELIV